MSNEDWRQRRADEILGKPSPWLSPTVRPVQPAMPPRPVPTAPTVADASSRAHPSDSVPPPPRGWPVATPSVDWSAAMPVASEPPGRRATVFSRWGAIAGAVLLVAVGGVGWVVRGNHRAPPVAASAPLAPFDQPNATVTRDVPTVPPQAPVVARSEPLVPVEQVATAKVVVPPAAATASVQRRATSADRHRAPPLDAEQPSPAQAAPKLTAQRSKSAVSRQAEATVLSPLGSPRPEASTRSSEAEPYAVTTYNGSQPSFDCRRARGEVTRTICADPALSRLDKRLAARFSALDRSLDPAAIQALHHGETEFLNARQNCSSNECLAGVYRDRLRALETIRE